MDYSFSLENRDQAKTHTKKVQFHKVTVIRAQIFPQQFGLSRLGLSPLREDIQPQLHQRPKQHGPQWYAHKRQLHVRQLLQLGAQRQAEAQLEQHGGQVPGTQAQVRGAVAWVVARLAAACHLDGKHEDEDAIKDPDREEDEEPVPLHLEEGEGEDYSFF